ncbi:MAG: hypothetical protein H7144_17935 [Burkholderiales bacterium]|nr:hypothetical protein [Phycisphaerae bacterium]
MRIVPVVGVADVEQLETRRLLAFALDGAFASAGQFRLTGSSLQAVGISQSGKVLIGGQNKDARPFIARITTDGKLDSAFNGGKPAVIGSVGQRVVQLVSLASGKIEVNLGNAVARLKNDGTIDASFGTGGTTKVKNNRSISIDSTGAFFAAGNTTVARYGANGFIDTTWSNNGTFNYTTAPGFAALLTEIQAAVIQVRSAPGGRVMLAVSNGQETPRIGVLRLTSGGTLNTTFAGDGTFITPATFDNKSLTDFAVLPDSQSMLLIDREDGLTEVLALDGKGTVRNAVIDPADTTRKNLLRFAGGLSTYDQASSLAVTPDGKVLITGGFADPFNPGQSAGGIARIKPDFTLDRTTAPDGDGVVAAKIKADINNASLSGAHQIIRAAAADAGTFYAILENTLVRLSTAAAVPAVTHAGNRIIISGTTARDFIKVSGLGNKIDVSINGEHFSTATSVVDRIEISTGAGDDVIEIVGSFPAGGIVISTRNGDDQVTINRSDTIVSARVLLGAGDDIARTNMPSVIFGDDGQDSVIGSSSDDAIFGGPGDDTLVGNENNDYIEGGAGHDFIDGSAGNDRILGDQGNDNLLGGRGNDTVYGADGMDTLTGNLGNDYLDAGAGNDTLYTRDSATDRVFGGTGTDSANRDKADILDSIELFI